MGVSGSPRDLDDIGAGKTYKVCSNLVLKVEPGDQVNELCQEIGSPVVPLCIEKP